MKDKKRNIGIELLRIFSMFLVVTMHVCTQGGIIGSVLPFDVNYIVAWTVMCVTYCATNCYALISGYVGVETKFSYHRIFVLWIKVAFYTVLITIVFDIIKPGSVGFMDYVKAFTPATSNQYWYFSAYFALFLGMPFLNFLVNKLNGKQLDILVITVIVTFSVLPTLRHTDPFMVNDGYSALWLMCLYIVGGYLKKRNFLYRYKKWKWGCLVISMLLIAILSKFIIEYVCWKIIGRVAGGGYLVSYVSPIILLIAIGVLGFFVQIKIRFSKIITTIASSTFFVFIIHEHPLLKHQFISNNFSHYAELHPIELIFSIFGTALAIMVVCTIIDLIREMLFGILKINLRCKSTLDQLQKRLLTSCEKRESECNEKQKRFKR